MTAAEREDLDQALLAALRQQVAARRAGLLAKRADVPALRRLRVEALRRSLAFLLETQLRAGGRALARA